MPCPDEVVREAGAAELVRQLRAAERHGPQIPLSASIDWSARCNLRCRHCFIREGEGAPAAMSTAEVKRAHERLAEGGVLFLVITGGEPCLRADFRELYAHAKSCGFVLTLFTNAVLIDDATADFLAARPPRRIEATIYGHSEDVYEAVTGAPGSFRRFREGVARLLARGLRVRLKAMLMTLNAHEFEAMEAWARSLDCDFRYDAVVHARLDGDRGPTAYRIPPAEIARLQFARGPDKQEFLAYIRGLGPELPARERLLECGAGLMTMHVDEHGRAHPCMLWRRDPYDLLARPLGEGWVRHASVVRRRPAPDGECARCRDRGLCGCCAPLALLETGQPCNASPFYCQLAAERKRQCRL